MAETIIKVENLGKRYRLGTIGTGTLSHDLKRWWQRRNGKEDEYLRINEKEQSGEYWALKEVSFEIKQGDAVGIIGKNGAGKSTLLKILSRVTSPTIGSVKIGGRIASLLEVGTGFHPELTGRENIFMNGAILGMTKAEIRAKLDEIIDFSGVEKYIDTPVKRYSSGMYVRLAFAVAAHLDPEILIVDEVLAVGDAEFQRKCLGKMNEVSQGEGRTVLFVSHNMESVKALCNSAILLHQGSIKKLGKVQEIINTYTNESFDIYDEDSHLSNRKLLYFENVKLLVPSQLEFNHTLHLEITIKPSQNISSAILGMTITNIYNESICSRQIDDLIKFDSENITTYKLSLKKMNLVPGKYKFSFSISTSSYKNVLEYIIDYPVFEIISDDKFINNFQRWDRAWGNTIISDIEWSTHRNDILIN